MLAELQRLLQNEGGYMATALYQEPQFEELVGLDLLDRASNTCKNPQPYKLALEAVYEGFLLHHGNGRLVSGEDQELALLLGDRLYALGLQTLTEVGDLAAIERLGELIALVSQAEFVGKAGLVAAVWQAGICSIGWGLNPLIEAAYKLAGEIGSDAEAVLQEAVMRTVSLNSTVDIV